MFAAINRMNRSFKHNFINSRSRYLAILLFAAVLSSTFVVLRLAKSTTAASTPVAARNHHLKLENGLKIAPSYRSQTAAAIALQSGAARPRALGIGDFNLD